MADLWDRSAELSARREEKEGRDKVKDTFYDRFKRKHHGASHPQQEKEEKARALKQVGINIEWPD